MVLKPNPAIVRQWVAEDIAKIRDAADAKLVDCPCCLGDGVVARPWPSPDPDPAVCPVCDQAGRVTPEQRDEWLGWQGGESA